MERSGVGIGVTLDLLGLFWTVELAIFDGQLFGRYPRKFSLYVVSKVMSAVS